MAGTIKTQVQLGDSATATQNFTLTSAAADGTMKLARGNAGATTQDILTVDASGNVNAPVGIQKAGSVLQALSDFTGSNVSLAANGYQKLPSGLIVQWGTTSSAAPGGTTSGTFPIAFPTACLQAVISGGTSGANGYIDGVTFTTTTISGRVDGNGTMIGRYIAIGY